ncbi:hypothetical protein Scep_025856 [Stephania cephalantha]|uniref:Uncharacterized protein n=1 Tax=Stephania cephalantha TaxID=152367 RepID=A0AAP0EMA2_9MAGN
MCRMLTGGTAAELMTWQTLVGGEASSCKTCEILGDITNVHHEVNLRLLKRGKKLMGNCRNYRRTWQHRSRGKSTAAGTREDSHGEGKNVGISACTDHEVEQTISSQLN